MTDCGCGGRKGHSIKARSSRYDAGCNEISRKAPGRKSLRRAALQVPNGVVPKVCGEAFSASSLHSFKIVCFKCFLLLQ